MTNRLWLQAALLSNHCWLKQGILIIAVSLALIGLMDGRKGEAQQKANPLQLRLGERLFHEQRFTTSKGDLVTSCAICHTVDDDPQGTRAYTDFFNRSWVPYRTEDPRRSEIRNSPTILDAGLMPRLHFDGEFGSLEELVKGTFSGRPMGWLPGEEAQAFTQVQSVLLQDKSEAAGDSYREQFKKAYDVELESLSRDQIISLVSKTVADYLRTLNSKRNSPYDRFVQLNGLDTAPAKGETGRAFGEKMLAKLSELEATRVIKFTGGFNRAALDGYKIFLRADGQLSAGNCVVCHAPPLFTDYSFHNIGISQVEYDQFHGEGEFAALPIPNAANARRPSAKFRETPTAVKPGEVDLGYWNFVDLKSSPLRRHGESDDQLLERTIGAFKTPTLRHLAYTFPYMHTGSYSTLEDALRELMRMSDLARAGRVRQADDELSKIRLTDADIAPLVAFLNTLNEELKRGY